MNFVNYLVFSLTEILLSQPRSVIDLVNSVYCSELIGILKV